MDSVNDVLGLTADYAAQFLGSLDERPVRASATIEELRAALGGPLLIDRATRSNGPLVKRAEELCCVVGRQAEQVLHGVHNAPR